MGLALSGPVKPFALLLAIPVVAFAVARLLIIRFDDRPQASLLRDYPGVPAAQRASLTWTRTSPTWCGEDLAAATQSRVATPSGGRR